MSKIAVLAWIFFIVGFGMTFGPKEDNWILGGGASWPEIGCVLVFFSMFLSAILAVKRITE